jgi:G6PDH family F420-dependent oxidoreductase
VSEGQGGAGVVTNGAVQIGYAAMLAQFPPAEAVALAEYAERHGFSAVMATDHFQPWVPAQGESSFVWSVLAALAERTTGDFGPGVTAPTYRWQPAMVAQASATLASMHPGRHWLGLGSGGAVNEHIVGQYWPEAADRINRMFEAVEVNSKLFSASLAGRDVKHSGEHFKLESTRLWTMPAVAPEILIATSGPVTAKRAGRTADGLITVEAPPGKIDALFARYREGARDAGKDASAMPKMLQLHLSWAETDELTMANALRE